jgi:outer membrane beta-barrel protein
MPAMPLFRFIAAALLAAAGTATAQTVPANTPSSGSRAPEPVVVPQVERRTVRVAKVPTRDFAIGLMGGLYSAENFGSNGVGGVRLGYHITEDFFVDGVLAQTKVSDEAFRRVLPGGIFPTPSQQLRYYAVSAGWNVLTGEAFFGTRTAKAMQGYIVAGIGSTDFAGQRKQTVHYGVGIRVMLNDRFSTQVDFRNHSFPLDLLGVRQTTNNPELSAGITVYF